MSMENPARGRNHHRKDQVPFDEAIDGTPILLAPEPHIAACATEWSKPHSGRWLPSIVTRTRTEWMEESDPAAYRRRIDPTGATT